MVQLSLNDDYQPNSYFAARCGEQRMVHCVGTSCDNLVALHEVHWPAETQECPAPQPPAPGAKPCRSEAADVDDPAQIIAVEESAMPAADHAVISGSVAAPAQDVDYYATLRRRSLDGHSFSDVYASELY